jgi:hypothetical protein
MKSSWWSGLLLGLVFLTVGLGLIVGGVAARAPVVWGSGLPVAGVGAAIGVTSLFIRREQRRGLGTLTPVAAGWYPAAGQSAQPWPFAAVAAELQRVLEPTPYLVEASAERIRVRADLADARFLAFAGLRGVRKVFATDVIRKAEGIAVTANAALDLDWTVGLGGASVPRLTGRGELATGKVWSSGKTIEWGAGPDGRYDRQVDYTFSSSEITGPVSNVLSPAGWRESWPIEAKGAGVMGLLGACGGLAVGVLALLGKLS